MENLCIRSENLNPTPSLTKLHYLFAMYGVGCSVCNSTHLADRSSSPSHLFWCDSTIISSYKTNFVVFFKTSPLCRRSLYYMRFCGWLQQSCQKFSTNSKKCITFLYSDQPLSEIYKMSSHETHYDKVLSTRIQLHMPTYVCLSVREFTGITETKIIKFRFYNFGPISTNFLLHPPTSEKVTKT